MQVIWTDKKQVLRDFEDKARQPFEAFEAPIEWAVNTMRVRRKLIAVADFYKLLKKMNPVELKQMCKNAKLDQLGSPDQLRERLKALAVIQEEEEAESMLPLNDPEGGDLDLSSFTVEQLRELARKNNITYSGLKKDEMIAKITEELSK